MHCRDNNVQLFSAFAGSSKIYRPEVLWTTLNTEGDSVHHSIEGLGLTVARRRHKIAVFITQRFHYALSRSYVP